MGAVKYVLAGIVVLALLGVLVGWDMPGLIAGGVCQDIYAYYPSFRCCDEKLDYQGSTLLHYESIFRDERQKHHCPDTVNRCEILVDNTKVYVGTQGCGWSGIFGEAWVCSDDIMVPSDVWYSVPSGAWVHSINPGVDINLNYKNYVNTLCECSLSPCGVPCPDVQGADGCGFDASTVGGLPVYDSSGRRLIPGDMGYFYTVPFGDCYTFFPDTNKHPIGNTCEDCVSTQDCAGRYGLRYNYFGKDYGAVCGSGHVQLYDCLASGVDTCVKWRQDANGDSIECMEYGKQSKCDLYLAIPVQCCPGDSSCGPQSFCGEDFLCHETVACYQDGDCGHTVMCDYVELKLKTPACVNGQCDFTGIDVECCEDLNCPAGYYCAADYTCKERTATKEPCPFECCVNAEGFIDRPCAEGKICCPDQTCQVSCDGLPAAETNLLWLIIPILGVLFGLIGYLKSGTIGAVILGIIGGLAGYVIFWFFSLPWWAQWLVGIGLGAGGIIIIYLFGGVIAAALAGMVYAAVGRK